MITFAKEVMTSLSLLVWHCEVLNFGIFINVHTLEEANSKKAELIKSEKGKIKNKCLWLKKNSYMAKK